MPSKFHSASLTISDADGREWRIPMYDPIDLTPSKPVEHRYQFWLSHSFTVSAMDLIGPEPVQKMPFARMREVTFSDDDFARGLDEWLRDNMPDFKSSAEVLQEAWNKHLAAFCDCGDPAVTKWPQGRAAGPQPSEPVCCESCGKPVACDFDCDSPATMEHVDYHVCPDHLGAAIDNVASRHW